MAREGERGKGPAARGRVEKERDRGGQNSLWFSLEVSSEISQLSEREHCKGLLSALAVGQREREAAFLFPSWRSRERTAERP